ncbi:DUF2786 domain-containing protein [Mycobacterium sp. GA-2829]|uniref:DUF2786 domain-containing protein n=1 Tax=Mycobacterium sp. GA-2829 TaxID=1772283 RepID=UPI000740131B|nr:DUF2786 domain-containing protein [Mycobacterium sp. GA-2829]KUI38333.1 hypothetical protein AU194_27440 [Mycobacterium sp. GA-2829]
MGKSNRERRMAKQRRRRRSAAEREHRRSNTGPKPPEPELGRAQILDNLIMALSAAAVGPAPWRAAELLQQHRGFERELDIAADLVVQEAIRAAWQNGWSPTDLHEVARRRVNAAAVRYLDEAIVLESQRYSTPTLHPRWRAELAELTTGTAPTAPQMWRWAAEHSVDERAVVTVVLEVLHLLATIPPLERTLPLPGEHRPLSGAATEVDEKMLARIRALLAKAEATEYPDEAEALSSKAQALMVRHSLKEAVADHGKGRTPVAAVRRIWIDNPYVAAKVVLAQAVAQANRCRVVWIKNLGCVVAVGSETDLDLVDLLTTSLLVQANRAMLVAGRRHDVRGQTRTKSFRLAFLVAYAARIGQRLAAASSSATAEMQRDERLLPVLAARNRAADEAFDRLFPTAVETPLTAYDPVGTNAGRAAADTAVLDVRNAIAS